MNFGTLLHAAQKNEKIAKKEPVRYYSTKFEPPKKEQRSKELSANIKRFLAKKESEEQRKQSELNKKKDELLALRAQDKKATRRVNVMLKRTKSANQSAIQDAVDKNNTSVTAAEGAQPDEDDYGYVSQEAAAFYNKMMEKYSKMPNEPKFLLDKKKKVSNNLSGTKDRVKAALELEKEEANMPHKRKRRSKIDGEPEEKEERTENREEPVRKKSKPPPPPLMNFNDLLKIAEKKQFEPIVIEQKVKEEERLLTKKQKKEWEREKEWRDRKEGRLPPVEKPSTSAKIPKLPNNRVLDKKVSSNVDNNIKVETLKRPRPEGPSRDYKKICPSNKETPKNVNKVPNRDSVPSKTLLSIKQGSVSSGAKNGPLPKATVDPKRRIESVSSKPKEFPPRDLQTKKVSNELKPKQPPSKGPKQFPPPDVRRKEFPPRDVKRKPLINKKGRILDDEDYDSEMDDFIDDGPGEDEDYSKHIREIFGYDKSRYRNLDDDDDDANMVSSFAQQMREEVISKKIGIMEDLEDMRKEEEDKKRKAQLKKKGRL